MDTLTIENHRAKRREREAARVELPPQTIVLVACAKKKATEPRPARDLYTSTLFRKARNFAASQGDNWFILSALHGLVSPDEILAPYEFKLTKLSKREREQWAGRVYSHLRSIAPSGSTIIILAGKLYRDGLEGLLVKDGYKVEVPMRGMGLFEMIKFLAEKEREAGSNQNRN